MAMLVRYLGHSSFMIGSSKGTVIVCDPYSEYIPYKFPQGLKADVALISHEHRDHNADYRLGAPLVVKRTTQFPMETELVVKRTNEKLTFYGVPTFHDNAGGRRRGPNTVWHWYQEGIHYCHLGDLGHLLTDQQVAGIGKVDVLFLPCGGKSTLNATEAVLVMNQLEPNLVFPMHYLTEPIANHDLCSDTLEDFLNKVDNIEDAATMAVDVDLARLPSRTKVVILKYE
ncbi:MAG TPA: MBL fold metallo-hydrolase [Candidatus Nitrosotenuis sp.]|jgi:L-ascorbate metabolism protein UlaG (beta-lactamase superfamily)|nr:MBL fold metallo-hydrolase [Candidatus Nitrosotenuis sp.]